MWSEKDEVTLSFIDPPKTFYYPHDPKRTGNVDRDYPPYYLLKETGRLTEYDFITQGKKMNKKKIFKQD